MYLRSTLVSFVIALGLAAYWFAFEHAKAPEDPRQTLNQDMTDLRVEQIVRIQIQSSQRPPTTLTRKPGSPDWQLDKRGPVDRKMVHAMYTALHDEKLYGQLTGDLEQFGLDQPVLTVTLVDSDDKQTVLHFGDADPSGRRRYLMRGSSSRVYLVRSRAYSAFDQQANDLRDRRVMPVNAPAKVAQVSVTQGANTWSMMSKLMVMNSPMKMMARTAGSLPSANS